MGGLARVVTQQDVNNILFFFCKKEEEEKEGSDPKLGMGGLICRDFLQLVCPDPSKIKSVKLSVQPPPVPASIVGGNAVDNNSGVVNRDEEEAVRAECCCCRCHWSSECRRCCRH